MNSNTSNLFEKQIALLNKEQARAVNKIQGAILVLAGPGSGKTKLLVTRIGKILKETDTSAHHILCLTFTNAAVQSMREKLLETIGVEAHNVAIHTYHSFAQLVINEHNYIFKLNTLKPLTFLEKHRLIKETIDSLDNRDKNLILGKNSNQFLVQKLMSLYQAMSRENWSLLDIKNGVKSYLESLPSRNDFIYKRNYKDRPKGSPNKSRIDKEKKDMQSLFLAAKSYEAYQKLKKQRGLYEFDDMIRLVLDAFNQYPFLLQSYQERYLYFMVDEFQDTNRIQNSLIELLSGYWENPNILVVGDDDQGIYEFQGARIKNIKDYYDSHQPNLETIILNYNYRSSQNILNLAKRLIEQNGLRLINSIGNNLNKNLIARNQELTNAKEKPLLLEYQNPYQESLGIVLKIKNWQKAGVNLNEVAILYKKHSDSVLISKLLSAYEIPYTTKKSGNILQLNPIRQFLELIEYLHKEYLSPYQNDGLLFRILHFGFWGFHIEDINKIIITSQESNGNAGLRKLMLDKSSLTGLTLKENELIFSQAQLINELIHDISNEPLPRFLQKVLNRTGMLNQMLVAEKKDYWSAAFYSLFDFVNQSIQTNSGSYGLSHFLEDINYIYKNQLTLDINYHFIEKDAITLSTLHSSKGLEYKRVFIINLTGNSWTNKNSAKEYKLPDTLTFTKDIDEIESQRRLLFVGITRAMEYLQLSFTKTNEKNTINKENKVFTSLLSAYAKPFKRGIVSKAQINLSKIRLLNYIPEKKTQLWELPRKQVLDYLLENFRLSPTALNLYKKCPISFYFERVLKVPQNPSVVRYYGASIHNALFEAFEKWNSNKGKNTLPKSSLLESYSNWMWMQKSQFNSLEFNRFLERGLSQLSGYHTFHHKNWCKDSILEKQIIAEVDGVPIKGIIDRIDFSKGAKIVDYKSSYKKENTAFNPKLTTLKKGKNFYWNQIQFYGVLVKNYPWIKDEPTKGIISYVESNPLGLYEELEFEINRESQSIIKSLIKDAYADIRAHKFDKGCEDQNCKWCEFVKNDIRLDTFSELTIELMDDNS